MNNESEIRNKKKKEKVDLDCSVFMLSRKRERRGGVCQHNVWIGKKKVCMCNVSMQESTGVCYCFAAG